MERGGAVKMVIQSNIEVFKGKEGQGFYCDYKNVQSVSKIANRKEALQISPWR